MQACPAVLCASILTLSPLWAASPPQVNPPGVHNFHYVDDHVYRGAQPTVRGFKNLAKLGVRTVIDLRGGVSEQKIVEADGMHYVHVPMAGLSAPSDQQIATIFAILNDPSAWPVFVHCKRGADRTGTVVACYRIAHDHWDNQKALTEAKMDGMSWIERAMQHYVLQFHAPAPPDTKPVLLQSADKQVLASP